MMTISDEGMDLTLNNVYKLCGGIYVTVPMKYILRTDGVCSIRADDEVRLNFCIKEVIYHDPATIIKWKDGTKTVVKCDEHDTYDPEKGLYIAILKKLCGNRSKFYKEAIEPWLPKKEVKE